MISTTLNRIKEHEPCKNGWEKLLKHLNKTKPDDDVLPYSVIVKSNGLQDALWCCRAEPQYSKEWRLFAVWCGRQVEHLMKDKRSINALNVAERFANGEATDEERVAAWAATWDAAWEAAGYAVGDAVGYATWDAARDKQTKQFLKIVS